MDDGGGDEDDVVVALSLSIVVLHADSHPSAQRHEAEAPPRAQANRIAAFADMVSRGDPGEVKPVTGEGHPDAGASQ
jgi:hypothetical protein